MARSHLLRFIVAAAAGGTSGLVIAGAQALPSSAIGVIAARILGWGWGWGASVVLLACLLGWGLRRQRDPAGTRLTVLLGVIAALAAFTIHWTVSAQLGGSWSWWGLGAAVVSPVLGLLGWWASARSGLGTCARTLVPGAAMVEALVLAPGADATGRVAWFELLACAIMVGVGMIASIMSAGIGRHAGVAPRAVPRQPVASPIPDLPTPAPRPLSWHRTLGAPVSTHHQPAA